jgi:hypothetical protein
VAPFFLGILAVAGTVVLEAPNDPQLLQRVLGQAADLHRIEVVQSSTATAPMSRARALARGRDAEAVVWIERGQAGGYTVTVVHLPSRRLLSREVSKVSDRRERGASATREAVALIVRSTLQAMEAWREREDPPPPPAPPPPPPLVVEVESPPPPPPPAPVRAEPALAFEAVLGWGAAADRGAIGPHGPELRLALRGSIWSVGLELSTDLPVRLADALATIELTRYRAGLSGGVDLFELGPVGFAAALGAGPSIHRRSTVATGPAVIATPPSTTVALAVGGELRIAYRIGALDGMFGLELGLGADGFVGAPEIAYDRGGENVARARSWPMQPYLRLGFLFRSDAMTRSEESDSL